MQTITKKGVVGSLVILSFISSLGFGINNKTQKQTYVMESVLSDVDIENETVSFESSEQINPDDVVGEYSVLGNEYSTPKTSTPETAAVVETEKIADPSQRYRDVDEDMYVYTTTNIYAEDNENSQVIKTAEYADYIHKIGNDPYNTDGFSKIEIDGQEAYIATQSLTDKVLFKERNQPIYATQDTVIYSDMEMTTELTRIARMDSVQMIGESHYIDRVYINDTVGYVSKDSVSTEMVFDESNEKVWALSDISLKSAPDDNSESVDILYQNDGIQRIGISKEWSKLQTYSGTIVYVRNDSLTTERPVTKGEEIANFALQFVGNPYVWGGTSLTNGTDCSGFTQSVYAHFGYSLTRTTTTQINQGRAVSYEDAQPGDLIFYSGHVAIYIGNGQIVHASNSAPYPQGGIKVSPATYTTIIGIRRIV